MSSFMVNKFIKVFTDYLKKGKKSDYYYCIFSYGTVIRFQKSEELFFGFISETSENQITFDSLVDIFSHSSQLIHNSYTALFTNNNIADEFSITELQDTNGFPNFIIRLSDNILSLIIPVSFKNNRQTFFQEALDSRQLDYKFPKLIAIIEPDLMVHKFDVYDEITDFSVNPHNK